jgi:hypothetical protein
MRGGAWLALAILSSAATASAARRLRLEQLDLQQYPFIVASVSAIDDDGRVIDNLAPAAFDLLIDSNDMGSPQTLTRFSALTPRRAIDVAVVVEVSTATADALDEVKQGIRSLADSLAPPSRMALISYGDDVRRHADLGAPTESRRAVDELTARGAGEREQLATAVRAAIDQLDTAPKGDRKLIVLFSRGGDSLADERVAIALRNRAEDSRIAVDTIAYGRADSTWLSDLNRDGPRRTSKDARDVRAQLASVGDEIAKQYVLTFLSLAPMRSRSFPNHTLQISVNNQIFSRVSTITVGPIIERPPPPPLWPRFALLVGAVGLLAALAAWLGWRVRPSPPRR